MNDNPLAELINNSGLNYTEIGEKVDLTRQRIGQIAAEGTKDIDVLRKIANAIGVPKEEVYEANDKLRQVSIP